MNLPEPVLVWLKDLETRGKSDHTVAAYRRGVQHFLRWNAGAFGTRFDPAAIIPRDLRDWKSHQQTREEAQPATINQRIAAVSQFFAWAVEQGLSSTNPASDVGTLNMPRRKSKGLSPQNQRRLLRVVHKDGNLRDIAIIETLLGTGLRVEELLNLRVGDVAIQPRSGKVIVRQGKGSKYREIPLNAEVRLALRVWLSLHPNPSEWDAALWLGQRGPLKDRSAILRMLNKYAALAKIEAFGPHILRHTFSANYLRQNPDDLRGLAALLGHSSLNTVMIYTEPSFDDLAQRVERVG